MDNSDDNSIKKSVFPTKQIIQVSIQLLALALLIGWSFRILDPFITPVIWAAILAVALYPIHQRLKKILGNRGGLAAALITILMLALIILPSVMLGLKTADEVKDAISQYHAGKIAIPPPSEQVKTWPLVGSQAYGLWSEASTGVDSLISKHPDQVRDITSKSVALLASTGKGIFLFALSIIISGLLLSYAQSAGVFMRRLFNRLLGNSKIDMAEVSIVTIRNVVKGILGVAFIQSALAAGGFLIAGIPAAGIWALLCLILAIIQIGVLPVSIGVIIYIWSTGTTTTATLLTIWLILVGLSDNFLKPWLLGKGAPVPMVVVFLGSLGGFILSGFIGLFTGAVILSLGYKLFSTWLEGEADE